MLICNPGTVTLEERLTDKEEKLIV